MIIFDIIVVSFAEVYKKLNNETDTGRMAIFYGTAILTIVIELVFILLQEIFEYFFSPIMLGKVINIMIPAVIWFVLFIYYSNRKKYLIDKYTFPSKTKFITIGAVILFFITIFLFFIFKNH